MSDHPLPIFTAVVRQLFPGRTTVQIQLLTVPPYVVGAISTVLLPWLSGRFRTRGPIFVICSLFMITGYAIFVNGNNSNNAKYAGIFLATIGTFPLGEHREAFFKDVCADFPLSMLSCRRVVQRMGVRKRHHRQRPQWSYRARRILWQPGWRLLNVDILSE